MPDLLVTAAELRSYLDLEEADLADARAELIIGGVGGLVRAYTNQLLDVVAADTVTLDGTGTDVLLLPELPVTDVTAVTDDGDALAEADNWAWTDTGILWRLGGNVWTAGRGRYEVTYDHGHATIPDAIRMVVLRVAARAVNNPEGLTQEGLGGYTAGYGFDSSRFAGLSDADRRELDPYRVAL